MTQLKELTEIKLSPMMQQWKELKDRNPSALLLFRLGDFYEAFFDDAKILSESVDVILTQRQAIPMSGVPHHQLENYLDKLMEKQLVVAIAEQVEEADATKGLVKREIVEIVSPATYLGYKQNQTNYFFAALSDYLDQFALSFLELSTGQFQVVEAKSLNSLLDELAKIKPIEILVSPKFEKKHGKFLSELKNICPFRLTIAHESRFDPLSALESLKEQFGAYSIEGFGLKDKKTAIIASGALVKYLKLDLLRTINHIKKIQLINPINHLSLDHATLHHLSIFRKSSSDLSLRDCLDFTVTPMGSRLLEYFICHPLIDVNEIKKRQDAIQFLQNLLISKPLMEQLGQIRDLQRLIKRAEIDIIHPKEVLSLKVALDAIDGILKILENPKTQLHFSNLGVFNELKSLQHLLEISLVDDVPLKPGLAPLFKKGFNQELDTLYAFKSSSATFLESYQNQLKERFGIKNLKVGYNRAFGYFIEVSRGQSHLVGSHLERLQTLVNAERFISLELKEYAYKMDSLEQEIQEKENHLYMEIKKAIRDLSPVIEKLSEEIAYLDVISGFAFIAQQKNWSIPIVDQSTILIIEEGKHPILTLKQKEDRFIPNDVFFDDRLKMMLITGPNMAGKSTYIRQTALLVLMAQIGSFVPAKKMHIGYFDQIFSRIGASDDLNRGLSTFMVEMTETANILHHASSRSLIILDEIGRGTSTYDGIAIASSVAEYLVSQKEKSPKTLFATHYFELTELAKTFPLIQNFHVAIDEKNEEITFLRKIMPGVLNKSFGIHVAKLAGLPESVIKNAKAKLKELSVLSQRYEEPQLSFNFEERITDESANRLKEKISNLDLDNMTAKNALELLYQLQLELKS